MTKSKKSGATAEILQRQNELVLNAAGEGIYGLNCEGITTFVNPAAARMLGWDSQALVGQPMHTKLHHSHPDGTHYPREECPIYAAFKDGAIHEVCDEVFWRKDGSSFSVEYTSTPIFENDKLIGAVVVFRDVTERKQTEDALRESEERFRKLFDHSSDGVVLFDAAGGDILNANPNFCDMLGYSRQELLSMNASDIHPHELSKFRAFTESVVAKGDGRTDELTCLAKGGEKIAAEISASTFIESDGGRQLFMAAVRDITERKQSEEALRKVHAEVQCLKDRLHAENIYLQEEIKTNRNFEEIIGNSSAIKKLLSNVEQVADTNATVLILGETGTGKELVARAIHNISNRRDRVLVKVNCATLHSNLIESELFGHKKGSFTGAIEDKSGRFELADNGTIFLDEIGELPIELQAKLLRVLQEGEFERLGDSKTVKVDIRVIAATNRNLKKGIEDGSFREDLYYRLNVFPLDVPALRQRKLDIPLLVNFFSLKFAKSQGKEIKNIPENMMKKLQSYSWPGNIRELENIIERAVILSKDGNLKLDDSFDLREPLNPNAGHHSTLEDVERKHIISVLDETNWTISGENGAAGLLGLNPNTLRSRIQKLGINRKN